MFNSIMSKEGPLDPTRRKIIKAAALGTAVVAIVGWGEIAKWLSRQPEMSPDEFFKDVNKFIKDFDYVHSLLTKFEGTQIPHASGYEDWKVHGFEFDKVYKLSNINGKRSLAISDKMASLSNPDNYIIIYEIRSSGISKTMDVRDNGSTHFIAEALYGKEITLLSSELLSAFSQWAKTAPIKPSTDSPV